MTPFFSSYFRKVFIGFMLPIFYAIFMIAKKQNGW